MKPTTKGIPVVGLDPSLRNWGIAQALLYPGTAQPIQVHAVDVIQPVLPKGKQVRQNSLDIEAAKQLTSGVLQAVEGAKAVFIEVPVGSQSARAMASYGICVGVLGALRATGIPFFEVTPTEVKLAGPGIKTATKQDMISWATQQHPEANWPTYVKGGEYLISEAKAEHMADACAAIHAGILSNPFQQLLPFLK
jgi:Holliday junction resolvasome RuvABC endonuclease subunit